MLGSAISRQLELFYSLDAHSPFDCFGGDLNDIYANIPALACTESWKMSLLLLGGIRVGISMDFPA